MNKPHFIIKNRFQKRSGLYQNVLTPDILSDVCLKITGSSEYECTFDNNGYNKGRMATLQFNSTIAFITFSDTEAAGRNSSFQSVSSALLSFHQFYSQSKEIYFYFLPSSGNYETAYFTFMYRLMLTNGIKFLNQGEYLTHTMHPFIAVEDLIANRNISRVRNQSNNSSFVTRGSNNVIQIYGKTYGANKYETTLMCLALSRLSTSKIELYEICEQNLSVLPRRSLDVINSLGNVSIIPTDQTMERSQFEAENSLRSPRFIFNLFVKFGSKKCALCGCEIPELINGAHIWPVSAIKKEPGISLDQKIVFATDGENGLWLCENHHKLLDEYLISINLTGLVMHKETIEKSHANFINWSTRTKQLIPQIVTSQFKFYLQRRYDDLI